MNKKNEKKEGASPRSLKRLVLRLAFCASHDMKWYVRFGLREQAMLLVEHTFLAGAAALQLLLWPVGTPFNWIKHSIWNGDKVDALAKLENNEVSGRAAQKVDHE